MTGRVAVRCDWQQRRPQLGNKEGDGATKEVDVPRGKKGGNDCAPTRTLAPATKRPVIVRGLFARPEPRTDKTLLAEARHYLAAGEDTGAMRCVLEAVKLAEQNRSSNDEASKLLSELMHRSDQAKKCRLEGNAAFGRGDMADAERHYTAALELFRTDADARANRAAVFLNRGDFAACVDDARKVLREEPLRSKVVHRGAKALLGMSQPLGALAMLDVFDKARQQNSDATVSAVEMRSLKAVRKEAEAMSKADDASNLAARQLIRESDARPSQSSSTALAAAGGGIDAGGATAALRSREVGSLSPSHRSLSRGVPGRSVPAEDVACASPLAASVARLALADDALDQLARCGYTSLSLPLSASELSEVARQVRRCSSALLRPARARALPPLLTFFLSVPYLLLPVLNSRCFQARQLHEAGYCTGGVQTETRVRDDKVCWITQAAAGAQLPALRQVVALLSCIVHQINQRMPSAAHGAAADGEEEAATAMSTAASVDATDGTNGGAGGLKDSGPMLCPSAGPLHSPESVMFAAYSGVGAAYRPHVDNHHARAAAMPADDAPGAPAGGTLQNDRALTLLCYLNDDWNDEDGGELRIHPKATISMLSALSEQGWVGGRDGGGRAGPYVDFLPRAGRIAIFDSTRVHEVLPATGGKLRLAMTMWALVPPS